MIFYIKSYLQFLWNSKNEHGVHSPFVYNLLTKCFYDKKIKPEYQVLKNHQKSIENKITSNIGQKRVELLFRIVTYFQPSTVLEFETLSGFRTSAILLANPKVKIIRINNCSEKAKKKQLQENNFDAVGLEITEFLAHSKTCDFIYFGESLQEKEILDYFEFLLPTISNETLWVFDAIHSSLEMENAWEIIKKHPKVTVTIDTFWWGLVFFRREQEKEHFVIRI